MRRCAGVLQEWTRAVGLARGSLEMRVGELIADFRDRQVTMPRDERDDLSAWLRDWLHAEAGRGGRGAKSASVVSLRVQRLMAGVVIPGGGVQGRATDDLLVFMTRLLDRRPANQHSARPVRPIVLDALRGSSVGIWKPIDFDVLVVDVGVEDLKKGARWSSWA